MLNIDIIINEKTQKNLRKNSKVYTLIGKNYLLPIIYYLYLSVQIPVLKVIMNVLQHHSA